MTYKYMREELSKLCAEDVTRGDAVAALSKLRKLEREKPTAEELTRGGVAGGLTGVLARGASGLASGDVAKGLGGALRQKGVGGKALGLGKALGKGLHSSASSAAGSATFGAGLPTIRRHLDREAEKDKLRGYLGEARGGKVRSRAKKYLGV